MACTKHALYGCTNDVIYCDTIGKVSKGAVQAGSFISREIILGYIISFSFSYRNNIIGVERLSKKGEGKDEEQL